VVVIGIHDGHYLEIAWFLSTRRTFAAYLDLIASKKEQS
jgi:hypothetical protein